MKSILPINDRGSIRIRFTLGGARYSFAPVPNGLYRDRRDLKTALAKAAQIENDIMAGNFDQTLARYRLTPKPTTPPLELDCLEIWDKWVDTLDLTVETKNDHYRAIRRMIVKHQPKALQTRWLTSSDLGSSTFSKRRRYLKKCFDWAVDQELAILNPWDEVKPRKTEKEQIIPFSFAEMRLILAGFEAKYGYYTPFVKFLMLSGARISESIGLRWGLVDFARSEITISESLSIDRAGNGYTRIRKCTKSGSIRVLPMNDQLRDLLEALPRGKSDEIIFKTIRGKPISDHRFRQVWTLVLKAQGIDYRRPYILRHSLLSHAIDQGIPLTAVAYLAGHSSAQMIVSTYGHVIGRPNLPRIDL
jgi:integrase